MASPEEVEAVMQVLYLLVCMYIDAISYHHMLNMELDLQSLLGLHATAILIWAHIRGRY